VLLDRARPGSFSFSSRWLVCITDHRPGREQCARHPKHLALNHRQRIPVPGRTGHGFPATGPNHRYPSDEASKMHVAKPTSGGPQPTAQYRSSIEDPLHPTSPLVSSPEAPHRRPTFHMPHPSHLSSIAAPFRRPAPLLLESFSSSNFLTPTPLRTLPPQPTTTGSASSWMVRRSAMYLIYTMPRTTKNGRIPGRMISNNTKEKKVRFASHEPLGSMCIC
jgi:hypothetical protein